MERQESNNQNVIVDIMKWIGEDRKVLYGYS